jgi:ribosomal protein S6
LEAQLVPENISELERRMKLEANVIRHLVVRIDE